MSEHILEMKNMGEPLKGADLTVEKGEIHALLGESGSLGSDLIRIACGMLPYGKYSGEVRFEGRECRFKSLKDAENEGIVVISRDSALIPELTIAENLFLGNEQKKALGVIDWKKTYERAREEIKKTGLREGAGIKAKDLARSKRKLVEAARALAKEPKLLILEETLSFLDEPDQKRIVEILAEHKRNGGSSLFFTSDTALAIAYADRITVIRDGRTVETLDNSGRDANEKKLVKAMTGKEESFRFPAREHNIGRKVLFQTENKTVYDPEQPGRILAKDLSMEVHQGEVTGFYGLKGSGKSEIMMSLLGSEDMAYVFSKDNFEQWLSRPEINILILDEPAREATSAERYDIYGCINKLTTQEKAQILVSSDLSELLGMCDTVYVMKGDQPVGCFNTEEATREKITSAIRSAGGRK